jgi:hypothetical protein
MGLGQFGAKFTLSSLFITGQSISKKETEMFSSFSSEKPRGSRSEGKILTGI